MVQQRPSPDRFVVRPVADDRKATSSRLAGLGKVQDLEGDQAVLLHMKAPPGDPKAAWRRVHEELGQGAAVYPVLVDEAGDSHYPTGDITVRFHGSPSDHDLHRFASAHGLRLCRRNEFAPQQAVFAPEDSKAYLPDVVEKLAGQPEAERAWANTLSRYRRLD